MPATDFLDNLVLQWGFKGVTFPAALANTFIALYTTLPAKDGTGGVEVTGGSYARVPASPSDWNVFGSPKQSVNTSVLSFPIATGSWGTVLGYSILDAASGGNILWFSGTNQISPVNGDPVVLNAGQLIVIGTV